MATYLPPLFILLFVSAAAFRRASAAAPPLCCRSDSAFIDSLHSRCPPLGIEPSSAIEISGDTLDRELNRGQEGVYYSVLFYTSWCPFSRDIRPIFGALSSMYPQVTHLAVKESSAMPSVFSRYGVHSFPTILLGNRTTMVRYYGSKGLSSFVRFYKETTGLDPVADLDVDQPTDLGNLRPLWIWNGSPREIVANEPYLAFSLLFIFVKAFMHMFPNIISGLKYIWVSYAWLLNLGIFCELSQLLAHAMHLIDIEKLCNKLRLCNKARNFQNGAKNARVWASSLASVSLGEASSRTAHSPQ